MINFQYFSSILLLNKRFLIPAAYACSSGGMLPNGYQRKARPLTSFRRRLELPCVCVWVWVPVEVGRWAEVRVQVLDIKAQIQTEDAEKLLLLVAVETTRTRWATGSSTMDSRPSSWWASWSLDLWKNHSSNHCTSANLRGAFGRLVHV